MKGRSRGPAEAGRTALAARRPTLRRSRWGPGVAAATLAVVCVLGPLASLSAVAAGAGAASPAPAELSGGTPAAPFAERAGYSPTYLAAAGSVRPASGTLPVEVTFTRPLGPAAYAAAEAFFRGEGLEITSTDPDRLAVGLQGAASVVGPAFSTALLEGSYRGSPVVFPAGPPSLPADLESEVAGVVGLSSGFTTFSFDLEPPPVPAAGPADANEVTPALARQFYSFSSLYNLSGGHNNTTYPVGSSIAVVLWGEGYSPSDIASFFSNAQYYWPSFPLPNVVPYPVDGAPYPSGSAPFSPDSRAVEELTLDIEWAGSLAPGATIDVVYAPDGSPPSYSPSNADLTAAFAKAISLNVSAISMSFGTVESADAALASAWAPLLQDAESKGITVVAATGDTGGDTLACSGTPGPEYPASSPQVLAVGGTTVTIDRPPLQPISFSESGWNDSGGGFSTQFPAPSWQEVGSAAGPVAANGHRGMPDVSASAADNLLYFNGSVGAAAGTSFATPLWAALVADIDAKWGQSLGFFTPSLYHVGAEEPSGAIGDGLADVTGGANCVAAAGPGWDEVTGWGSPRADVLYDDLLGSFVNIGLSVDRTTVAPGGSIAVSAQLTNRTSHRPIAGVAVDLSVSADTDLGPCTGTFGAAAPLTNATGWASATFSVPLCYLGQHALVNASVTTTKLYGTSGLRVDVNLLGLLPQLAFLEKPPWAYVTYSAIVGAAAVLGVWIGRPKEPAASPRPVPTTAPSAPPPPPTPPAMPGPPAVVPPTPPAAPEEGPPTPPPTSP